jgi:8-oxo-dGTP pyrophosphatase MutT (NUDIX family)
MSNDKSTNIPNSSSRSGGPRDGMPKKRQKELFKELFGTLEKLLGLAPAVSWNWWNNEIGRFRASWAFRGMSDEKHPLTTKLERMSKKCWKVEPFLYRNFKKYAEGNAIVGDSDWHLLSVAQHHDLPTRLLDWTNSPLVALHFATCETDKHNVNGVVWMVDFAKAHSRLPQRLGDLLTRRRKKRAHAFTVDELARKFQRIEKLDAAVRKNCIVFFEPPSIDARIANQYALFSVKLGADKSHQNWADARANRACCQKVIIPARLKPMIRDFLDQMNINERVLFPGLDGLCGWLARYYGESLHKSNNTTLIRGSHLTLLRHRSGWEYVSRPNSNGGVIIVAVTAAKKLLLIEQMRHPLNKPVIELPAGLIGKGTAATRQTIVAAAKRELEEESGYKCRSVAILASGATLPGMTDELNTLCFAKGLIPLAAPGEHPGHKRQWGKEAEGEHTIVHEVPIDKVAGWLKTQERKGAIIDLKVFAGLYFLGLLCDCWRK